MYWHENGTFFKKKSLLLSITRNSAAHGCLVEHALAYLFITSVLSMVTQNLNFFQFLSLVQ